MATYKEKQIAIRVPPGDNWKIHIIEPNEVIDEPAVYSSLMDVLEAFYTKYKYKGDFKLSPSKGKLFVIVEDESIEKYKNQLEGTILEMKKKKNYSIYGDLGEK